MESNSLLILLLVIVIPLFFWMRVKSINKKKNGASVSCSNCGKKQWIAGGVYSYNCSNCDTENTLYDKAGQILQDAKTYRCMACGEINPDGIITCKGCGMARPDWSKD